LSDGISTDDARVDVIHYKVKKQPDQSPASGDSVWGTPLPLHEYNELHFPRE
jgi:hypothetical protein